MESIKEYSTLLISTVLYGIITQILNAPKLPYTTQIVVSALVTICYVYINLKKSKELKGLKKMLYRMSIGVGASVIYYQVTLHAYSQMGL